MLIRHGYEMTFTCGAPTSMVSQLDVHPSCVPAVRAETPFAARPHVASWLYADVFGNRCRRFNAPSGDLTISNACVIEVSGLPDPVTVDAVLHPRARIPGNWPRQAQTTIARARANRCVSSFSPARRRPMSSAIMAARA
jgi:hypothetical protein